MLFSPTPSLKTLDCIVSRSMNVSDRYVISSSTPLILSCSISQTSSLGDLMMAKYLPFGDIENVGVSPQHDQTSFGSS